MDEGAKRLQRASSLGRPGLSKRTGAQLLPTPHLPNPALPLEENDGAVMEALPETPKGKRRGAGHPGRTLPIP